MSNEIGIGTRLFVDFHGESSGRIVYVEAETPSSWVTTGYSDRIHKSKIGKSSDMTIGVLEDRHVEMAKKLFAMQAIRVELNEMLEFDTYLANQIKREAIKIIVAMDRMLGRR